MHAHVVEQSRFVALRVSIRYSDLVREMTASEASRNFSAVLDAAEEGETIVVTRAGRRVATIAPALTVNAPELRAVFSRWQGDPAFDDGLEGRIEAARSSVLADLDNDPWLD